MLTTTENNTGLRKIRLQNVQSVSDLTLDFEKKGVYRLVGDNDIGKSAILRGINALFHNVSRSSYKEYISDWADTFIVEGWFYDGGYVKLSRGANDFYEWSIPSGSNTVMKTDGKVPLELQEYFNLYTEKDKSKITLNFNLQGDVLPFVDTSTSDNFWLSQKAFGTNILLNASKNLKSENNELGKGIKTVLTNIEKDITMCKDIANEIEIDNDDIAIFRDSMTVLEEEYAELVELIDVLGKEKEQISRKERFESIPSLSEKELNEMYSLSQTHSLLKTYLNRETTFQENKNRFNSVSQKVQEIELESLQDLSKKLVQLKEYLQLSLNQNKLREKSSLLEKRIISEKEISDFSTKVSELQLLMKYAKAMRLKNDNESLLEKVRSKVESSDVNPCLEEALTISLLKKYLKNLKKNHSDNLIKKELHNVILNYDNEIKELKQNEKICPLCGSNAWETDANAIHRH